jgi:hypothetical protein
VRGRRGIEAIEFALVGGVVLPLILLIPLIFSLTVSNIITQHALTQTALYTASRAAWSTPLQNRCVDILASSYGVGEASCEIYRDTGSDAAPACPVTMRNSDAPPPGCIRVEPVTCPTRPVGDCLSDQISTGLQQSPRPDWILPRLQRYRLVVEYDNQVGVVLGRGQTRVSRSLAFVSEEVR